MAGVEDEDEFRDADDGAGTSPPPPPPASTPSKPKPAAAAGGFGRRLLASIGLPTSLSTAIGRSAAPPNPKPSAPHPTAGPNLGLGLLLHQGLNPSADGSLFSDASARNLHLPPTAHLQKRPEEVLGEKGATEDGEDQVIGHYVGVGEELPVLVPTEEKGQEKEDVADGCSGIRNGCSAQDLDKEREQHKSNELGPAMEDQEVMEQEGATKYYNAVEDQSNNDAEQCTDDAPAAIKDDRAVEEKEEAVEQGCAVVILGEEDELVEGQCEDCISVQDQHNVMEQCRNDELGVTIGDSDSWVHDLEKVVVVGQEGVTEHFDAVVEDQSNNSPLEQHPSDELGVVKDGNVVEDKEKAVEQKGDICILRAAEDGIAVGSRKEDVVVEDPGKVDISVPDQYKVVDQCNELGVPVGDSAVHDQEVVVVEQEGVTEHFDAAVEDQIDNAALKQHASDELRVIKDGNVVENKEKVVEQEAAIDTLGAAKDGLAVGLQEEDAVVEGPGEHDISVQYEDNVVDQGTRDELGVAMGDSAAHDQGAVEQESLVECFDTVMEDQCNNAAMVQCTSDELTEVKSGNGNVVEEKVKAVEQEGAVGLLYAAEDGACVGEEDVVVKGQGEDGISIQDKHKVMDQCMSDELEVTTCGSVIQDHDSVAVDLVTEYFDAMAEDQSNSAVVEQFSHDESEALRGGNFVEVKEKAVQQVVIDIFGAAKDHVAVQLQEQVMVVEGQGEDGISILNQYQVVEQCRGNELEATMGDSIVQDQEVVVEQEGITEYFYAALEDQNNNASVMQCTCEELSEVKDDNIVETKEKALEQEVEFGILGAAENSTSVDLQGEDNMVVEGQGEDGISVQDQHQVVDQCISDDLGISMDDSVEGQDEDGISVQDQHQVVDQCISDDLGISMDDSVVQDKEVSVLDQEGVTRCFDSAMEHQSENSAGEQCTNDEQEAAKDDNFVEEKEKAVVEGSIDTLGSAKDDVTLGSQEEGEVVVVAEQGEDVVSLQDQYEAVEQCTSDQVRTTTDVNAVHDEEVVEQGVICVKVVTVDDIAIDAQEKAVKQSAGDESSAAKDTDEKVVDQDLIEKQDAIKGDSAVESQEDEGVAVNEQGEDDISVRDQYKLLEQRTRDQWRTTTDDNAAEDQEVRKEKIRLCVRYPQRPGRSNCRVYMSTGSCPYGLSCYLNHPQVSSLQLKTNPEVPSFPSEQGNREAVQILELNRVGLPIRENARNCMYYMRNGTCGYGKRCCYNHPEHVLDVQIYKPTGWDDNNLPSSPHSKKSSSPHSKKSSEHANLDEISSSSEILPANILRMLLPPQSVPPGTEAMEMKDPDWSSASDDSDGCCSADSSGGPLRKQEHHVHYPERSGRQECPFLLKYGNCKFASSCQYYHPNDKFARTYHRKDPSLSEELMVYPDRPGAPECPFYMKTGACKFRAQCKFHHPKDLRPSIEGPTIPKGPVDAKELHLEAKITLEDNMDQQQNYPERPGQPECRYYMQFGKCKFLSHGETDDETEHGHDYPERPGENECLHYMKHGY
ncbi:hypothetical protein PR202_gb11360 [Eleusine coracana subsp. coracana]|uniref:C3H1-type domain-containing protein n=1 Tax=Eleusine coracana subsp. coracana TaxID=191504 RepID=A0AAV5EMU9_ELECO|nr:hypothetical protein PR202_gb11360 [Eleusine coracana subsp. coracana]